MRTTLTLSLPFLLAASASAQCPIDIPSYTLIVNTTGLIETHSNEYIWMCGGSDLHNEGAHCVFLLEEGATLYLVGDSNVIYTKGDNYIYLNPGSDYNLVFHEGGGANIANNGSFNGLVPCTEVIFDYSLAPGGGCVEAGIADPLAPAALVVYPSPVIDRLHIGADGPLAHELRITDMVGHEHMRIAGPGITSVDMSRLTAGTYVVHLLTDAGKATHKVLKL